MKNVWILVNGMKEPAVFGRGNPEEKDGQLFLTDDIGNVLGRISSEDLKGWWAQDVGEAD